MDHVLIVEDHEENRNLFKILLEANGYRVTAAGDGLEALAAARRDPPDAIVSDVLMPKMDGFALCRAWMQDAALRAIPFIFYSATYVRPDDEQFAMALGAVRYLIKPVKAEVFLRELRAMLQQWAGHAAPTPASPLDDAASHALHESALARKLEDKMAQLEAANRKLRESEEKYRRIYDNLQDVYVESSLDGTILEMSPQVATLSKGQYKREDLIGTSVNVFYADSQYREAMLLAMKQQGRAIDMESMFRNRDGSLIPCSISATIVRAADGKLKSVATLRDITERKRIEEVLRNSEAELKAAQRVARIGNWYLDLATGAVSWSEQIYRVFGRDPELPPPTYAEHGQFLTVASTERMNAAIENSKQTGTSYEVDLEVLRADGTAKWIAARGEGVRDDNGQIVGLRGTAQDISERKAQELKIARLSRIQAVLSGINALIVRVRDRDELFRETCRIAVEAGAFKMAWIGVIDPQTLDGKIVAWHGGEEGYLDKIRLTAGDGTPDSERPACRALRQMQPVICNDLAADPSLAALRDDLRRRGHKSAACFPLTVTGRPDAVIALFAGELDYFDDEEARLLLELAGNISFAVDHIEKAEKLNYLAYYDVLTGLANRSLFLEWVALYMRSAVRRGHKLALFVIDLERFKNINDSLGQSAGDALLRQVAKWLTRNAVGDGNLVARVGVDHFAVVLPEVKQESNVVRLLEKWIEAFLEHRFHLNDAVFRISHKVGIALFPDDGVDADTLFKNAEAALKKAKASGDRYLFYTQKMTETVAGKLTLENQLRQALDKGEFVLHYQPKVNLASGKLASAEALIRWNDPRTGLVLPGRFIPILEETGLIYEVGRWALRQAIEDYLRWRSAGLAAVRIAVNVSPLQLRNPGFIAEIRQAIGIDAHAAAGLELEITESLIMEDVKHSIASLQAIRAMGVSIAIDDFGTGFSSLSYLAKLPVDTLKIDRSFVIDMTAAPEGLALVSTIISLTHSLKLKVVAEGVETEEQSRLLRLLNCDEMQGFLFSKPVPGEIFETRYLAPPPAG
jgi:diguanylate cyclase (GGDEF)-like protein/PAS domain S-box-containing protein